MNNYFLYFARFFFFSLDFSFGIFPFSLPYSKIEMLTRKCPLDMLRHCHEGRVVGDQERDWQYPPCSVKTSQPSRQAHSFSELCTSTPEEEPENQSCLCSAPLEVSFL